MAETISLFSSETQHLVHPRPVAAARPDRKVQVFPAELRREAHCHGRDRAIRRQVPELARSQVFIRCLLGIVRE